MGLGLLHVIVTTYILHIHYIYTLPNIALVTTVASTESNSETEDDTLFTWLKMK